jgi:hypothetical protein
MAAAALKQVGQYKGGEGCALYAFGGGQWRFGKSGPAFVTRGNLGKKPPFNAQICLFIYEVRQ